MHLDDHRLSLTEFHTNTTHPSPSNNTMGSSPPTHDDDDQYKLVKEARTSPTTTSADTEMEQELQAPLDTVQDTACSRRISESSAEQSVQSIEPATPLSHESNPAPCERLAEQQDQYDAQRISSEQSHQSRPSDAAVPMDNTHQATIQQTQRASQVMIDQSPHTVSSTLSDGHMSDIHLNASDDDDSDSSDIEVIEFEEDQAMHARQLDQASVTDANASATAPASTESQASSSSSMNESLNDRADSYFDVPYKMDRNDSADTAATSPKSVIHKDSQIEGLSDYQLIEEMPPKDQHPEQLVTPVTRDLQTITVSDLKDIPLSEETPVTNESTSPISALTSLIPDSHAASKPVTSSQPLKRIDTAVATAPTAAASPRSLFNGLWSPFKNVSMSLRGTASATPTSASKNTQRPSSTFTARQQKMLSRPPSVIAPLTVSQEALLAEMEQLNSANTNDPKAKVLLHIKRQSMRRSIMVGNPLERKDENMMTDDYDWELWASIICEQDLTKPIKLLPKHVQRGVPPALRGMVWQLLAQSKNANLEREYSQLLKLTSPYEKMIQRDLARTFPGHEVFKDKDGIGQEGLFNVMRAYSVFDQEVGYCQGLAFVVGPLLLNMPDEEAFCVFVQMMNKYGFRGHFTPDMEGLHLRLYQFDALLAEHLPHVARHLQLQGVRSTMYASQWFMTLFAYKFPLELVFLIYDVILAEGASAIFKFAIALLKRNETTILGLDFEQLLDFLKNKLFEEYKSNDRRLVDDACALQISPKRLFQLEKEHKQQLAKELADAKLLDELQQTNIAFKKKAKDLEFEVAELRREHQDVSEQLIESKDNLIHLYDERDSLQDLVDSLQAEVTGLPSQVEQQRRSQFDELCNENSQLVHKNCLLEDQLASIEALLIDMKMKYAQSENQKEELQRTLFEIKRSITT